MKFAHAVLLVDGRYALQLRDHHVAVCPNQYGMFGGAIESGESPQVAVRRELLEELELDVRDARHLVDIEPCHFFEADVTLQWPRHVLHEGQAIGLFTYEEVMTLSNVSPRAREAIIAHRNGPWAAAWHACEAAEPMPERLRDIRSIEWGGLRERVMESHAGFVRELVASLHAGDAWFIKGVFSPEFMREVRERTVTWTRTRPESFHKMLEGSPDFHRMIDLETGRKYSILSCKHSAYFYRWNDDPLGIWPEITDRWRVAKIVMGLAARAYESFTPKDGVVDRIQVVRYPPSIGYLEPHVDAWQHQRCFFSAYMSKEGRDYQGGGFYFVDKDNRPMFMERDIEVGDVCLGHANLLHGVAPCDRGRPADWNATDGRWFLSLYSNASDEVPRRATAKPVKIHIPEVMP